MTLAFVDLPLLLPPPLSIFLSRLEDNFSQKLNTQRSTVHHHDVSTESKLCAPT